MLSSGTVASWFAAGRTTNDTATSGSSPAASYSTARANWTLPDENCPKNSASAVESVGEVLYERQDPGSSFLIRFVSTVASGTPELREHTAVEWVAPADIRRYSLAPTDQAFVDAYIVPRSIVAN